MRPHSLHRAITTLALLVWAAISLAQTPNPHFLLPRKDQARALSDARAQHADLTTHPRQANLSTPWTPVGPAQILSTLYGPLTGRVTAIAQDPNNLYIGTTGGGIWRSTDAAQTFTALTDGSIGAIAVSSGVILAGTGDPNDATDSYYGTGILRSTDAGLTWSLVTQTTNAKTFFGTGTAGLAFSTANPAIAVAAITHAAEGDLVNAPATKDLATGLVYTTDAGLTWQSSTVQDGTQTLSGINATAVLWNPLRQRFYAAIQYHGYYDSPDGITWSRLAHQPAASLTTVACPPATSTACPIFRGTLALQPTSGDLFALTVDAANHDQGLTQDLCASTGTACASPVLFGQTLNATPLETTNTVIPQADYNLTLAAAQVGTDTILYAGTIDLYRCALSTGCTLRNTTNTGNGCTNRAGVFPAQHALAALGSTVYIGNDGGLYRSTDAVAETGPACSLSDASHFQNLNLALGSLAEVDSFAQDPTQPGTLLAGLGALGTAGTGTASAPWPQLATGEGGTVAIDPATPANWYLSLGAAVDIGHCTKGSACAPADVAPLTAVSLAANDPAAIHAPWLLDPALPSQLLLGTCRTWRGPVNGTPWSSANILSAPYAAPATTACPAAAPVVRSLAAGGPASARNGASQMLYAGLAGSLTGGGNLGGHLFATTTADLDNNTTAWTDLAKSPVTNDSSGLFNPGGFDLSSVTVDPHDPTGQTLYATILGFAGNGISAAHLYRSTDAGAHWLNVSSNLPNAPANSVVVDPNDANTVYLALDTGVYVTQAIATCPTTNCWSVLGASLPNAPVIQLLAAPSLPTGDGRLGLLRAATYGRGIWQTPLLTATSPAIGVFSISPLSVTYSAQQVGTVSSSVTITVTNTGNASISVSNIITTGDFVQTNTCTGTPLAVNATCQVQATFAPTATGTRTGTLTIYGNVATGQATVDLSGIATAPATIVLTPASLAFPATTVGTTSPTQNLTIANTGGTLSALQPPVITGDFKITGTTCGSTLAPQNSCTVSLAFTPTSTGQRAGTLTITDDAGTQVAPLSGTATAPATDSLAPASLTFTSQALGTASPTQSVTLTNAGDTALTLIAAQITTGDFTVTNACGNSLNPHSSCDLLVAFTPKSLGVQSGTLTVSDQFRTQTVPLTGTGIAPAGVSLAPTNGLAFAPTGIRLTAPTQTITLTNNGGLPLAISGITTTGDYTLAPGLNTCQPSLAPAAVCTVAITFAPTATGTRTGTFTITDNAANSPQTLPLAGIGIDFTLASTGPSSLTIANGQTATYGLLLASAAGLPGSVPFTCSGLPTHASCSVNPATGSLGGSQVITVTVATGLATASLTPPNHPSAFWLAALLPCLLGYRNRRRRTAAALFLVLTALVLLSGVTGCSTGRTVPFGAPNPVVYTTPPGTYTILVAGSTAGLVRSVDLTLIVQ